MEEQKEQVGRNSQKFVRNSYEIRTKFVRISYEFHISRKFTQIYSREIRTKFVRNSYEFRTNFVRISREFRPIVANTQSKHTSRHTLQSHGQVMLHAPVIAHLGDRHAGTVFTRCHSVVGRPGGAMPDKAKWISDSASTSPPFTTSSWCTLPRKNSMHWGPTSMTARSVAGADREMKVGWKGQVGGPAGSVCGGSANRAWAASPSHNPTLATAPFPTHNTWSTLGRSQLDKSPATSRASLGGMASKCVVLAWWCLCRGSGVHKLKRAPCSPSLESGWAGNP